MNEQLQQALADILNKTMAGVEAGTAFLQAELPDVIQQLLLWKLADAAFSRLVSIALLFACYALGRAINNGFNQKEGIFYEATLKEVSIVGVLSIAFGAIAAICAFLIGAFSASTILQIWLAPKIYLIEYAARLAN